jgi:hypothetical protein
MRVGCVGNRTCSGESGFLRSLPNSHRGRRRRPAAPQALRGSAWSGGPLLCQPHITLEYEAIAVPNLLGQGDCAVIVSIQLRCDKCRPGGVFRRGPRFCNIVSRGTILRAHCFSVVITLRVRITTVSSVPGSAWDGTAESSASLRKPTTATTSVCPAKASKVSKERQSLSAVPSQAEPGTEKCSPPQKITVSPRDDSPAPTFFGPTVPNRYPRWHSCATP